MDHKQLGAELHSIRSLMERSAKFISLSGLSGILAGFYALMGAGAACVLMYRTHGLSFSSDYLPSTSAVMWQLTGIGVGVLVAAVATALLLSRRKARALGQQVWNPASKGLLRAVAYPLVTGGLLALIFVARGCSVSLLRLA